MKNITDFHGHFGVQFQMFLKEKRALGIKYLEEERLLHLLDDMSMPYDCSEGFPKELVLQFIERQPHWSQSTHGYRIHVVRQFARYLTTLRIPAYLCHPAKTTKTTDHFKPHIFTREEISDILKQADSITPFHKTSQAPVFYPVILRVLYGCGLRITEALSLRIKDVDLSEGTLYIHNSKNHKDRIVPMDSSLTAYCVRYSEVIHRFAKEGDYFFLSPKGGCYTKGAVYHYFRKLLWQCGISHCGRSNGPRLHDVRHTFAVHCMRQFEQRGIHLRASLPIISAYLGHSNISATGKYLRMTAENFPEIAAKLENTFGNLIPDLRGGGCSQ